MLIGAKAGIDLGVLAQIVPLSAGASRTFDNIPRSVLPGSFTAGGTLDIVAKDLDLACGLSRAVCAPPHLGLPPRECLPPSPPHACSRQPFPTTAPVPSPPA